MRKADPYNFAAAAAERIIREQGITSLQVDPIAIARSVGIDVEEKPASNAGVSGMLIRLGDQFCIAYATHIRSPGFRRFSVAHELGHYFLEGHVDAIFADGSIHKSRAGFLSTISYELEADNFAARLLMPNTLFDAALRGVGDGLAAVESSGRYPLHIFAGDGDQSWPRESEQWAEWIFCLTAARVLVANQERR